MPPFNMWGVLVTNVKCNHFGSQIYSIYLAIFRSEENNLTGTLTIRPVVISTVEISTQGIGPKSLIRALERPRFSQ